MAYENHWLPGFNFNVEEWFEGGPLRDAGDLPHARTGPRRLAVSPSWIRRRIASARAGRSGCRRRQS
jgi:hypothetical protein